VVVVGHGVTGNKDRPLLVTLCERLATVGVTAVRFSFAGNGGSEGRFEDGTLSSEVEDLGAVLDAFPGWKVGYAGHSMGAAVGALRAAGDPRIRFLVSLAGMAHTAAFAQREFGEVTAGVGCMWDKPECPLSEAYVEDMQRVGSVVALSGSIQVPWLLVHGVVDDVVPVQDSRDLVAARPEGRQLVELPEADHVFSEPHAGEMADVVVAWIRSGGWI
jgi:pimeloyl-ACP methyl ester carboxylesterase